MDMLRDRSDLALALSVLFRETCQEWGVNVRGKVGRHFQSGCLNNAQSRDRDGHEQQSLQKARETRHQ